MKKDLKDWIRDVPDFPKPGILFKDITPMLGDPAAFHKAIDAIAARYKGKKIDKIACVESRGFLFGAPLAYKMKAGLAIIRKPGKLPYLTTSATYELEYGKDEVQIHQDAILPREKVLIVDDLLATGGTVAAVGDLVQRLGGKVVECAFLIELAFLKGREKIKPLRAFSLIRF